MKRTHLFAVLASVAAMGIFAAHTQAFYNSSTGTWLQRDPGPGGMMRPGIFGPNPTASKFIPRDPTGQYVDGANLYQYAHGDPIGQVDPLGLWSSDFHRDVTLELAKRAGIACASDVAAGCNRPDEDERDAPSSFKKALALRLAASQAMQEGNVALAQMLLAEADRLIRQAREWHFPSNGAAANAKVDNGIEKCDFKLFSEGLHTLQDLWSHQGTPFTEGLGHGRGAEWVEGHWEWGQRWVPGYWKKLVGISAALSTSADDVAIWPEDARAAANAAYQKMLEFKAACPCACPGNSRTSSGDAQNNIGSWLDTRFPGSNKVK